VTPGRFRASTAVRLGPARPGRARSGQARRPGTGLSNHELLVTRRAELPIALPESFRGPEVLVRARARRIVAEADPRA